MSYISGIPHRHDIICLCGICLFLTYFTQYDNLIASMLLQVALFHSLLWLSTALLHIFTASPLSRPLSVDFRLLPYLGHHE